MRTADAATRGNINMHTSRLKFLNWRFVGKGLRVGAALATIAGLLVMWHDRPDTAASTTDAPLSAATIDNDVSGTGNVVGNGNAVGSGNTIGDGNTTRIDQITQIEGGVHIGAGTGTSYSEPSEDEIKQALLAALRRFGATEKGAGTLVVENASVGLSLQFIRIKKVGCGLATPLAGYVCYYKPSAAFDWYSNRDSPEAVARAERFNDVLQRVFPPRTTSNGVAFANRFVKNGDDWLLVDRDR